MQIALYDIEKKEVGTMDVPDRLFKTEWKPDLVHQAIVTQQANSRQRTALVKNRGDVRGGGRKPWKQKGTGRARHGSIRSPLWIGGGVTHGPTAERSFEKKINKKMKMIALLSLMSKKFSDGKLFVIEGISGETMSKTKDFQTQTKKLREGSKSALLVTSSADKKVFLASRNVPKVFCVSAKSLSVVDTAQPETVFITKQAIPELLTRYGTI